MRLALLAVSGSAIIMHSENVKSLWGDCDILTSE